MVDVSLAGWAGIAVGVAGVGILAFSILRLARAPPLIEPTIGTKPAPVDAAVDAPLDAPADATVDAPVDETAPEPQDDAAAAPPSEPVPAVEEPTAEDAAEATDDKRDGA